MKQEQRIYARIAYELGIAYFYCYEENGNRAMATKWLNIALDSEHLSEGQYKRTEILSKLSGISNIGTSDRTGDSVYSYSEYWDDLVYLISDDSLSNENLTTTFIVYRDFINQVASCAKKFQLAGISKADIDMNINYVEDVIINNIGNNLDASDARLTDLYDQCICSIIMARKSVENAYN